MSKSAFPSYTFKFNTEVVGKSGLSKSRTYDFYSDPGHGWMKVPKSQIAELGIENDISSSSHQRGDYAYLEEDQDATTFIHAMNRQGYEVKIHDHIADKQSKIRNYRQYQAN